MFTVSDSAATAIRTIISRPGVPQGAGMRIAADPERNTLQIAVTAAPQPGDVIYQAGDNAQIFVADEAGAMLDDKTIDTREDESGRLQFVLDQQP